MVLMKNSLVAAIVLFGCGCTLIPGSYMEGAATRQESNQLEQDLDKVNIQVIDSKVIASQSRDLLPKKPSSLAGVDTSNYEYRLGVGDVLSIGVWDHPELTIPAVVQRTAEFDGFRVQADGTITYAYAPKIPVKNKTILEVHDELVKRLSHIIEQPQVDVKVVGFRSQRAYVTGEVNKPGVFPITEVPLTLIDAINNAGGLTARADWKTVTFTRGGEAEVIALDDFYAHGDISQNRLLKHGDIVHISRNDERKAYVLGDVKQPGSITIDRYGLSLAEAISEARGLNEETANANGVFVLRARNDNSDIIADVYQLNAQNALAYVLAEQFELQPKDIVYVTTAPVARWNRLIRQLVPTISVINQYSEIEVRNNVF
ncbi:polysaccharide export protein [Pseudoalteromonas sp. T1lg22]|uniref:polysaccharide export protein n=1 Tax=Pseudoalteromonas sp. T1lg22 TaxID=2077096 RepID=UPI000CF6EC5F|nr:polysaccharide export protein [Pseudoalteromonas sp. T1lg22]